MIFDRERALDELEDVEFDPSPYSAVCHDCGAYYVRIPRVCYLCASPDIEEIA